MPIRSFWADIFALGSSNTEGARKISKKKARPLYTIISGNFKTQDFSPFIKRALTGVHIVHPGSTAYKLGAYCSNILYCDVRQMFLKNKGQARLDFKISRHE